MRAHDRWINRVRLLHEALGEVEGGREVQVAVAEHIAIKEARSEASYTGNTPPVY
jgi:hypothetical protein